MFENKNFRIIKSRPNRNHPDRHFKKFSEKLDKILQKICKTATKIKENLS